MESKEKEVEEVEWTGILRSQTILNDSSRLANFIPGPTILSQS
jgi:hypothetical protein